MKDPKISARLYKKIKEIDDTLDDKITNVYRTTHGLKEIEINRQLNKVRDDCYRDVSKIPEAREFVIRWQKANPISMHTLKAYTPEEKEKDLNNYWFVGWLVYGTFMEDRIKQLDADEEERKRKRAERMAKKLR